MLRRANSFGADNKLALNPDDTSIKASPSIYALDIVSGNVVWLAPTPPAHPKEFYLAANSAAPAIAPGMVFAGIDDGHIRAYSRADGHILWEYNAIKNTRPLLA